MRTTGDEKVYIAQALEMEQHSSWFLQRFAGESRYFKGPLHYILIRLGFISFGHILFSVLYMNLIAVIVGAIAAAAMVSDELGEKESKGWNVFAGISLATSSGVFAHVFASQMEVCLVACYALCGMFLRRAYADSKKFSWNDSLLLWFVIGVTAWLKSPLHSVLLSVSVGIYWIFTAQLMKQISSIKTFICIVFGVLIGISAYLPALFFDRENFINYYFIYETMKKGANGVGIIQAILPLFTVHLLPWLPIFCASWWCAWKLKMKSHLSLVSLAITLPTILFFSYHPYRSEIYAMPAVPLIIACSVSWLASAQKRMKWKLALSLISGLICIPIPLVLYLSYQIQGLPYWWNLILVPSYVSVSIISAIAIVWQSPPRPLRLSLASLPMLWGILGLMLGLGFIDQEGFKKFLEVNHKKPGAIGYFDSSGSMFNEAGLLQILTGEPVIHLRNPEDLREWVTKGQAFIVKDERDLSLISSMPKIEAYQTEIWKRLRPHGAFLDSQGSWLLAIKTHCLDPLMVSNWIYFQEKL